jgi:hypothetical protein
MKQRIAVVACAAFSVLLAIDCESSNADVIRTSRAKNKVFRFAFKDIQLPAIEAIIDYSHFETGGGGPPKLLGSDSQSHVIAGTIGFGPETFQSPPAPEDPRAISGFTIDPVKYDELSKQSTLTGELKYNEAPGILNVTKVTFRGRLTAKDNPPFTKLATAFNGPDDGMTGGAGLREASDTDEVVIAIDGSTKFRSISSIQTTDGASVEITASDVFLRAPAAMGGINLSWVIEDNVASTVETYSASLSGGILGAFNSSPNWSWSPLFDGPNQTGWKLNALPQIIWESQELVTDADFVITREGRSFEVPEPAGWALCMIVAAAGAMQRKRN